MIKKYLLHILSLKNLFYKAIKGSLQQLNILDCAVTHLDVEAAQHSVDAEHVSDGVIYAAV